MRRLNLFPQCVIYSEPVITDGVQLSRRIVRIDNPGCVTPAQLAEAIRRIGSEQSIRPRPARFDRP
jgi:hypothetical protein